MNADIPAGLLDRLIVPDAAGASLLSEAAEKLRLTARGYTRVLKVARTIADLDGADGVRRVHLAEALSYRHRPAADASRSGAGAGLQGRGAGGSLG